jgi:hypothetical protein
VWNSCSKMELRCRQIEHPIRKRDLQGSWLLGKWDEPASNEPKNDDGKFRQGLSQEKHEDIA